MARVLVVDDRPDILLMARLHLGRAGHEVHLAADGEHALELLSETSFDLVVVDPSMPTSEGRHVLDAATSAGPVLVISVYPPGRDAAYLAKPFDAGDLVAAAAAALAV